MARCRKNKVKLINVKPVNSDDSQHRIAYTDDNTSASLGNTEKTVQTVNLFGKKERLRTNHIKDETSTEECKKNIEQAFNAGKIANDLRHKVAKEIEKASSSDGQIYSQQAFNAVEIANDFKHEVAKEIEKASSSDGQIDPQVIGDHVDDQKEPKRKKRKRKKKDKKKKEEKEKANVEAAVEVKVTKEEKSEELPPPEAAAVTASSADTSRKWPCIFGFLRSWLAKRKERRRAKKRKAIEARKSATPVQQLVEYEHKATKGGVAFTLELDCRPMILPVLPPIKPRSGQNILGTDEKLKLADEKRSKELEKKKKYAKDHDKKKAECQERKTESEFYFKQKVGLTVMHKQGVAEKNRSRLQEDRRCGTPRLRAPSTLPPLRVIRVQPCADGTSTIGTLNEDPGGEFKF